MLHISLSASYLASLAVMVLILYVMNFPVSNAVQGAYLVAVVMTGLIIGGASLIFTELTEGLGCLLGGFCVSMWFLVLKPGGLLTSTAGVSAFIAAFSLAAFSTSFSHITRPYGLMVFTSFGGATVLVVGIDCFSRAGLKEFWAYIWNVNENLFPLGATTYPHTRGLKVEIAAIVLFFLAGLISQMKIWKVIEKHREQRTAERLVEERSTEQEEERRGRLIEERNKRDRQRWEAVYGEQDMEKTIDPPRDSGVGDMDSQKRGPMSSINSIRQSNEDAIEMAEMPPTPTINPTEMDGAGSAVVKTVHHNKTKIKVARDIDPPQIIDENGNRMYFFQDRLSYTARSSYASPSSYIKPDPDNPPFEEKESVKSTAIPKPAPLPFKVPDDYFEDDRSSVATCTEDEQASQKRFSANRLSATGSTLLRKLSKRSQRSSKRFSMGDNNDSTEELVTPQDIEDDRASSVAATVDDLSDGEGLQSTRSSLVFYQETEAAASSDQSKIDASKNYLEDQDKEGQLDARKIADNLDTTPEEQPDLSDAQESHILSADPDTKTQDEETPTLVSVNNDKLAGTLNSTVSAIESKPSSLTKDQLPARFSKVAMSYRTNEWAKHLSTADSPELEELHIPEASIEEEASSSNEIPVPVNVNELQQTAANVAFPARIMSKKSPNNTPTLSRSNSSLASSTSPRTELLNGASPNLQRSASQQSFKHLSQQPNTRPMSHRNSSTPNIPHQIIESPIEQNFSPSHPHGNSVVLHAKRDTLNRGMTWNNSTLASMPKMYTTSLKTPAAGDFNTQSQNSLALGRPELEAASMSQRLTTSRQSSQTSHLVQHQQNFFDSHQPKRQSSTPHTLSREQQLESWRSSVQQDIKASAPVTNTLERQRSVLWQARQAEGQMRALEERRKGARDSAFDERMRRGDMLDAHREAIRKMQGIANKSVQ